LRINPPVLLVLIVIFMQACSQQPLKDPRSDYHTVSSKALQKPMPYAIYTPTNWSPEERLPLVVLLHGGFDDHQTFDRYEVGEYLDQQMALGNVPRAIVVNPKGGVGFWENWYDGTKNYRDWVVRELLADISKRYPHAACPDHCHLMGISMGGHGVLSISALEPTAFATATVISGRLFTKQLEAPKPIRNFFVRLLLPLERIWGPKAEGQANAEALYQRWLSDPALAKKPLLITWGREDNKDIVTFNEFFHKELTANNRQPNYDGGSGRDGRRHNHHQ